MAIIIFRSCTNNISGAMLGRVPAENSPQLETELKCHLCIWDQINWYNFLENVTSDVHFSCWGRNTDCTRNAFFASSFNFAMRPNKLMNEKYSQNWVQIFLKCVLFNCSYYAYVDVQLSQIKTYGFKYSHVSYNNNNLVFFVFCFTYTISKHVSNKCLTLLQDINKINKLRGFSPQANYIDRAIAVSQRS
jgi:hypothetical protein